MKQLFAKWKAYREGIETRWEGIHDKIDKLRADWAKLNAGLKKRKTDMLKPYEEKKMAERKADQEKREAERKAYQEDLQKIMKEMMDANQTKRDDNQEGMDVDLKETREEIKSGEAEITSTVNAFQEKMDSTIANRMYD
jgi:chromosome segregation ATPase